MAGLKQRPSEKEVKAKTGEFNKNSKMTNPKLGLAKKLGRGKVSR